MSTPVIILENDIIECNHMCRFRTLNTPSIKSVGATKFIMNELVLCRAVNVKGTC